MDLCIFQESSDSVFNIPYHLIRNPRIDPKPEGIIHDDISVNNFPRRPVFYIFISWVAEKIAGEDIAGADFVFFQILCKRVSGKWSIWTDYDGKAEPAGILLRG